MNFRIASSNSRNFIGKTFLRLFKFIPRGRYPQGIATSNVILSRFLLLFIFAIFSASAYAENLSKEKYTSNIPLEQEYIDSFSENPPQIQPTPLYKKGIETLYLDSLYKNQKWGSLKGKKEIKFKMPDYQKALQYFLESFYNEDNLASAFMATRVIEFSGNLDKDIKNQILYFTLIDKLAQKNNCKALEREVAYYYYGKGGLTEDKKAALQIAKKASKICSNTIFKYSIDYFLAKEKK